MHPSTYSSPLFSKQQRQWLEKRHIAIPHASSLFTEHADTRRYYRSIGPQGTLLIMLTRPPFCLKRFIYSSHYLRSLSTATIYDYNTQLGLCLIEDLGRQRLGDYPQAAEYSWGYYRAIDQLIALQKLPVNSTLSTYSAACADDHIELCHHWFIQKLCNTPLRRSEYKTWRQSTTTLLRSWDQYPKALCHLDYHSDNLMWHQNTLYIIDHQDLCIGPVLYDVASLLFDHYKCIPEATKKNIWHYFCTQNTHYPYDYHSLATITFQRHLKNIGVFSRLALRDHKTAYLRYLPRMLACMHHLAHHHLPTQIQLTEILQQRYRQISSRLCKSRPIIINT